MKGPEEIKTGQQEKAGYKGKNNRMAQHGIIQHLLRQGCRKKACKQKPHAHHAQNQTVSLGTETVNMLEQERRTGQISEKGNEKEPFQKTMTHKVGIMEKVG